jgi:hypothetical protein
MIDLRNRSLGWMAFDVGLALALGALLAVF